MEENDSKIDFTCADGNKNISLVFVLNINDNSLEEWEKCMDLIREKLVTNSINTNKNINIVIIQNISINNFNFPELSIEKLPIISNVESAEKQNINANLIVIKNFIDKIQSKSI